MRISSLHLKNFKRFTDLQIKDIPASAKLVLLIGSNGSGKSSVFDVFTFYQNTVGKTVINDDEFWKYYKKNDTKTPYSKIQFHDSYEIDSNFTQSAHFQDVLPKMFYGRTSFRQIPRLTKSFLGQKDIASEHEPDFDRPKFLIDRDNRFDNDIERIAGFALQTFFQGKESAADIIKQYIEPINRALANIFETDNATTLRLKEIIPPIGGNATQLNFQKGESTIHYNYLSAGEKEVVNILINLLSRKNEFQEAIYYIDELDLHLNTQIQYNLLQEITENWIPEKSQLWTASHSLGFIEFAKDADNAIIIDLDNLDFDKKQLLTPEIKNNPNIYEVAVGQEFLASLFQDMDIFFVENQDKELYANVGLEKTIFVKEQNRNAVFFKAKNTLFNGIVDRDFLSDDDIKEIKKHYTRLRILKYYSIENYLFHPDNLEEYFYHLDREFDKTQYINDLINEKNEILTDLTISILSERNSYPYFSEPELTGKTLQNRFKNKEENKTQTRQIVEDLQSDDFKRFYKVLPMKTYCKNIVTRQNLSKIELSKTHWFKQKIKMVLD